MQQEEIKSILKRKYFGFRRSSHDFFESREEPIVWKVYAADFIACLEMSHMQDGNFGVYCRVVKDREMNFKHELKTFYSGIDALVCYEGWISDVRNEFYKSVK